MIRGVARRDPAQRFLALSVSDAAEDVIAVVRAGARGYVTKSISGEELAAAIERVRDGDAVFSPRLAGFVLDAFAGGPGGRGRSRARSAHVARARGAADDRPRLPLQGGRAAARHLAATVEAHVSAVLRKLQLSNRHELTRWAAERRLVD